MLLSRKHSQVVLTMMLTFIQISCVMTNYRKDVISVCISLLWKENNVMNVKLLKFINSRYSRRVFSFFRYSGL